MINKFVKLFILTFAIYIVSYIECLSQNVFNRAYDTDSLREFGVSVIQTSDNSYFIAGIIIDLSNNLNALFFVKTNYKGDTVWTKIHDISPGIDNVSKAIQVSDGSFIVCGTTKDTTLTNYEAFLMKLDDNGEMLWLEHYGGNDNDGSDDVLQTQDGGFIMVGWSYSYSNGLGDAFLVKTDSFGNLEWQKNYGGAYYDFPEAISIAHDGGYVFAGKSDSYGTGNNDIWIFKTNNLGDSVWQRTYGGSEPGVITDIKLTSDDGFILAGGQYVSGQQDAYILKTDSLGYLTWAKTFGSRQLHDVFETVIELEDSGYVITGTTDAGTSGVDGWLMKTSPTGDSLWSRTYSMFGGNNDDYVDDMILSDAGGFVMCGMVTNFGVPTSQDMWLVKTDLCGYTTTNAQPSANISIDSIEGYTAYFSNNSQDLCNSKWWFGDGDSSILYNAIHTYADTGIYTMGLIVYAGDKADTATEVVTISDYVGIHEFDMNQEGFDVYPNPFNSFTTLTLKTDPFKERGNLSLRIYDLLGKELRKIEGIRSKKIRIYRDDLPAGIYFYEVFDEHEIIKTGKLVAM